MKGNKNKNLFSIRKIFVLLFYSIILNKVRCIKLDLTDPFMLNEVITKPISNFYTIEKASYVNEFGESRVFRARRKSDNKPVVIKKFSEKVDSPYFAHEYKILKMFNHENIVKLQDKVYKWDENEDGCIVLEFIDGEIITDYFETERDSEELGEIMREVLLTIYEIHQKGIIHGNIRSTSVICKDGKIKLIGFGRAQKEGGEPLFITLKHLEGSNLPPESFLKEFYVLAVDTFAFSILLHNIICMVDEDDTENIKGFMYLVYMCRAAFREVRFSSEQILKAKLFKNYLPKFTSFENEHDHSYIVPGTDIFLEKKGSSLLGSSKSQDLEIRIEDNGEEFEFFINNIRRELFTISGTEKCFIHTMLNYLDPKNRLPGNNLISSIKKFSRYFPEGSEGLTKVTNTSSCMLKDLNFGVNLFECQDIISSETEEEITTKKECDIEEEMILKLFGKNYVTYMHYVFGILGDEFFSCENFRCQTEYDDALMFFMGKTEFAKEFKKLCKSSYYEENKKIKPSEKRIHKPKLVKNVSSWGFQKNSKPFGSWCKENNDTETKKKRLGIIETKDYISILADENISENNNGAGKNTIPKKRRIYMLKSDKTEAVWDSKKINKSSLDFHDEENKGTKISKESHISKIKNLCMMENEDHPSILIDENISKKAKESENPTNIPREDTYKFIIEPKVVLKIANEGENDESLKDRENLMLETSKDRGFDVKQIKVAGVETRETNVNSIENEFSESNIKINHIEREFLGSYPKLKPKNSEIQEAPSSTNLIKNESPKKDTDIIHEEPKAQEEDINIFLVKTESLKIRANINPVEHTFSRNCIKLRSKDSEILEISQSINSINNENLEKNHNIVSIENDHRGGSVTIKTDDRAIPKKDLGINFIKIEGPGKNTSIIPEEPNIQEGDIKMVSITNKNLDKSANIISIESDIKEQAVIVKSTVCGRPESDTQERKTEINSSEYENIDRHINPIEHGNTDRNINLESLKGKSLAKNINIRSLEVDIYEKDTNINITEDVSVRKNINILPAKNEYPERDINIVAAESEILKNDSKTFYLYKLKKKDEEIDLIKKPIINLNRNSQKTKYDDSSEEETPSFMRFLMENFHYTIFIALGIFIVFLAIYFFKKNNVFMKFNLRYPMLL